MDRGRIWGAGGDLSSDKKDFERIEKQFGVLERTLEVMEGT